MKDHDTSHVRTFRDQLVICERDGTPSVNLTREQARAVYDWILHLERVIRDIRKDG